MRNMVQNVRLGLKLPVVMGLIALLSIAVTSAFSSMKTSRIISENAAEVLESIAVLKSKRVRELLESIDRDLRLQSAAPSTSIALIALADGYASLENPEELLKRVYVDENQFPAGERDQLVKADTGSSYGFIHAVYHPTFDALQDEMGYYDIFLFDTEGNLVYSVFKETDFATNMINGPWADTGLAAAFLQANTLEKKADSVFVDFSAYAPSDGQPAAFLARPVFNEQGTRLGVIAYQMPISVLSEAAGGLQALGETADGFVVGDDMLMRTNSAKTDIEDTLVTRVEHRAIREALNGQKADFDAEGHLGERVIGFAAPIEFLGKRWVMIVQQDHSEVFSGLWNALLNTAIVSLIILGCVMAVAIYFSRTITQPVQKLTDAVNKVAAGATSTVVPCTERGDEIGDLAKKTEIFRQNAVHMEKMAEEQKQANARMSELNEQSEKAALREKELAEANLRADQEAKREREEMMRDLGASFGEVVTAALNGNFSARVANSFDDAVLNDLSGNINNLMESVEHGLNSTGDVLSKVAGGNLTHRMLGDFKGSFKELQGNVNNMLESLTSLISDISESGVTLSGSASELRQTADVLSRQAEQNAASVEETSAALEELTASMAQVDSNLADVSENARDAKETASKSEHVASEAARSMDRIAKGSEEINRVTEVINDIAFQINLLALNAGVEAARAGEAGRGFSVVASEVRQLAQRAGEAAKEIAVVLSQSDTAVKEGVANVSNAKSSLEEISKKVIRISENVEDVTRAISEQAMGIKEISSAVSQFDSNTQKQAAAFEEVTASSHVLANEADNLRQSTAQFQVSSRDNPRTGTHRKAQTAPTAVPSASAKPAAAVGAEDLDGWDEF